MLKLIPLIALFLLSKMQRHGAHGIARGERRSSPIFEFRSNGVRRRYGRFLQMNEGDDKDVPETAQPSDKAPPPPVTVPLPPVTPPPMTILPVTDIPTIAPIPPTTIPSVVELTVEPSRKTAEVSTEMPVAIVEDTMDPTNIPTESADSAAGYDVNLLDFVVSVDTTTSPIEEVTTQLETLLGSEFKVKFDSFEYVQLLLQNQVGSGRALLTELAYSGTASFDSEVWDPEVHNTQVVILEDNDAVQQVAPSITSIEFATNDQATQPPSPTGSSMALTIGVAVAAGIAVLAAIYFGYRYYSIPPPPPPSTEKNVAQSNLQFLPGPAVRESAAPDDGSSLTPSGYGRGTETDEYSLDGISANESEPGLDKTELYLMQRYMAKKQREQKQASSQNQQPYGYYFNNTDDGSDAGFSYDQVGVKGMESDDDVYTTESTAIEVTLENKTPNKPAFGYFAKLSSGSRRDLSTKTTTTITTSMSADVGRNKRELNEIPFDEASLDRPFDELPRVVPPLPPPPSAQADEQAQIIVRQLQYERQNNKKKSDKEDGYEIGRNTSHNSRKSDDSDKEDLSSFLRGRRQAKRAARKSRETRKQPPISLEI